MPLSLGCAIWSYPGWIGDVYPPKTLARDFLRIYARHFPAVEGNTTFYAIPDRPTLDRWIAQTPPGFKFCLKLPRAITHNGSLEPSIPQARQFIAQMQVLGDRLGVMFIQLPPHYAPTATGFADLSAFLSQLPTDVSLALEVRHLDWFDSPYRERLNELLTQLGIGRVILDSRPIYEADPRLEPVGECKKPRVPIDFTLTAPFTIIRYVSHPIESANQYWLESWTSQIQEWLAKDTQIYTFIHCPVEARSPINARLLHDIFTLAGISIAPLPPKIADNSPLQLKLF